jgi:hypothetical protein
LSFVAIYFVFAERRTDTFINTLKMAEDQFDSALYVISPPTMRLFSAIPGTAWLDTAYSGEDVDHR